MTRWSADLTAGQIEAMSRRNRAARVTMPTSAHVPVKPVPVKPIRNKPGYERRLIAQLADAGISGMVPEYRFHETRKWRIDVAFPEQKLAVEIDGAVHRIKERFHSDIEKHQALLFAGWRLLRVSTKQVRNGEAVKAIKGVMA